MASGSGVTPPPVFTTTPPPSTEPGWYFGTITDNEGNVYTITDKIQAGAYGTVFKATTTKKETRAIKVALMKDSEVQANMIREVAIQKQLSDRENNNGEPNVCPTLYTYGTAKVESNEYFIVVMELYTQSAAQFFLSKLPKKGQTAVDKKPIQKELLLDYFRQVAQILQRLETYEFNHRDLRSENVMTKAEGKNRRFVLIDFGQSCAKFDGVPYKTVSDRYPEQYPCVNRSRDLTDLVIDTTRFLTEGKLYYFVHALLTFNTLKYDKNKEKIQCKYWKYDDNCGGDKPTKTGDAVALTPFFNEKGGFNPHTTPENLLKHIDEYDAWKWVGGEGPLLNEYLTTTSAAAEAAPAPAAAGQGTEKGGRRRRTQRKKRRRSTRRNR